MALAGGTDLIGRMKDYVTSPDRVVYSRTSRTLAGISGDAKAGGLTIGAGTRLSDIVDHAGDPRVVSRRSGRRPSRSARPRSAT